MTGETIRTQMKVAHQVDSPENEGSAWRDKRPGTNCPAADDFVFLPQILATPKTIWIRIEQKI
jgi:hypothetical protein